MKPILLVEDDADDVFLIKTACERSGLPHELYIVRDGLEAVAYLSGDGPFADREKYPLPHMIFLDIKMPKMDGHQVLQWIRSQPKVAHLPVIMLTTSKSALDIKTAYQTGANSFLRKGENMGQMIMEMKVVLQYWLGYHAPTPNA